MTFKYISMRELESCRNRFNCVTLNQEEIEGTYFFEIDPDTVNVKNGRAIPSVAYKFIDSICPDYGERCNTKFLTVEVKNPKVLESIALAVETNPSSIDNVTELNFPDNE